MYDRLPLGLYEPSGSMYVCTSYRCIRMRACVWCFVHIVPKPLENIASASAMQCNALGLCLHSWLAVAASGYVLLVLRCRVFALCMHYLPCAPTQTGTTLAINSTLGSCGTTMPSSTVAGRQNLPNCSTVRCGRVAPVTPILSCCYGFERCNTPSSLWNGNVSLGLRAQPYS